MTETSHQDETRQAQGNGAVEVFDALVLGAGFDGLHMVHELRASGLQAIGLEAGSDAGGIKNYIAECDRVALAGYPGFEMR